MPLLDFQSALGTLIVARASSACPGDDAPLPADRLDLSSDERAWLARLVETPGLGVTRHIQRWWRRTRLLWSVRLTLTSLGAGLSDPIIENYLDAVPGSSLYFTPEAVGFLDRIIQSPPPVPHIGAIARFERALILAAEEAVTSRPGPAPVEPLPAVDQVVAVHPSSALVLFEAPFEGILATLLYGAPMPLPGDQVAPVLITPALPHFWRPASPEEARLYALCQLPASIGRLRSAAGGAGLTFQSLWADGAFCLQTPPIGPGESVASDVSPALKPSDK